MGHPTTRSPMVIQAMRRDLRAAGQGQGQNLPTIGRRRLASFSEMKMVVSSDFVIVTTAFSFGMGLKSRHFDGRALRTKREQGNGLKRGNCNNKSVIQVH